jgi:hypothetical protein
MILLSVLWYFFNKVKIFYLLDLNIALSTIFSTSSICVLPLTRETKSHAHTKQKKKSQVCTFNLCFYIADGSQKILSNKAVTFPEFNFATFPKDLLATILQ